MTQFSENATYEVMLANGGGPFLAYWNESKRSWIVDHPIGGKRTVFPQASIAGVKKYVIKGIND